MRLAISGHRPERVAEHRVRKFLTREFQKTSPTVVISGMAPGTDLWAADVALSLGIDVWCAKPWLRHGPRVVDKELYRRVEKQAKRVHVVTPLLDYPGPWVYQKRNEWMVDEGDALLAIWDGTPKGGTFNCVEYAEHRTTKPYKYIHPGTGVVTYGRPGQALSFEEMVAQEVRNRGA